MMSIHDGGGGTPGPTPNVAAALASTRTDVRLGTHEPIHVPFGFSTSYY